MSRTLFATRLYEAMIDDEQLLGELAHSIRSFAEEDEAGKCWSREKAYKGYTSYASLNDLPRRDPAFDDLKRVLTAHAVRFAKDLAWGVKPKLDSIWVNLLKPGGHHSAHIHPHSILSGTLYVEVAKGSGPIRFEDPRLPMMMAAPVRDEDAAEELRPFVAVEPRPGLLLLWESWLRHEVLPGTAKADRLSISFNFA
ncbi:TIGR02466 family protein [Sphingomonas sp. NSE70-1]|uniref:TIGR02466 family protein n=1 Tax=Sphingomonas caseinilyticus TaxID=2908205 RepID=A0ABT0RSK9_9SPHN|nr:TIGR02466 family protein [Sphingomonas caseinilyticus]MCL6697904.1 TIGR02466 family protein [Sphingomonas caseinilyticus]